MPGLIDNGAYFFGRDLIAPEIVTKHVMPKGKVELGEAIVVEYTTGTGATPEISASGTNAPAPAPEPDGKYSRSFQYWHIASHRLEADAT